MKSHLFFIFFITLIFNIAYGSKCESFLSEMLDIREYLRHQSEAIRRADDSKDRFTLTIEIRNLIYQRTPLIAQSGVNFYEFYQNLRKSLEDPEYGHICGGLALTYLAALTAFEIPNRYVGMFDEIETKGPNSHATVEVFLDDQWLVSDPTYNVMAKHEDRYIGYKEMRELVQSGSFSEVEWDSNGFSIFPNRRIQDYPVSMSQLLNFVVFYASSIEESSHLPVEWNQMIHSNQYSMVYDSKNIYGTMACLQKKLNKKAAKAPPKKLWFFW